MVEAHSGALHTDGREQGPHRQSQESVAHSKLGQARLVRQATHLLVDAAPFESEVHATHADGCTIQRAAAAAPGRGGGGGRLAAARCPGCWLSRRRCRAGTRSTTGMCRCLLSLSGLALRLAQGRRATRRHGAESGPVMLVMGVVCFRWVNMCANARFRAPQAACLRHLSSGTSRPTILPLSHFGISARFRSRQHPAYLCQPWLSASWRATLVVTLGNPRYGTNGQAVCISWCVITRWRPAKRRFARRGCSLAVGCGGAAPHRAAADAVARYSPMLCSPPWPFSDRTSTASGCTCTSPPRGRTAPSSWIRWVVGGHSDGNRRWWLQEGLMINQSITFKVHGEPAGVSWDWTGGEGCVSGVHSVGRGTVRCGRRLAGPARPVGWKLRAGISLRSGCGGWCRGGMMRTWAVQPCSSALPRTPATRPPHPPTHQPTYPRHPLLGAACRHDCPDLRSQQATGGAGGEAAKLIN